MGLWKDPLGCGRREPFTSGEEWAGKDRPNQLTYRARCDSDADEEPSNNGHAILGRSIFSPKFHRLLAARLQPFTRDRARSQKFGAAGTRLTSTTERRLCRTLPRQKPGEGVTP